MTHNDHLNEEEKRILDDFENGRFKVVPRTDPIYEKLYRAAKNTSTHPTMNQNLKTKSHEGGSFPCSAS